MYLLDSNIFLELLLDQDKADEVERLLRTVLRERLHISEFSLYSVCIVLFHRNLFETFVRFVDDLVVTGGAHLLRLSVQDMEALAVIARQFSLDFDDAYQCVVAEKYGLEIISLKEISKEVLKKAEEHGIVSDDAEKIFKPKDVGLQDLTPLATSQLPILPDCGVCQGHILD
jgi:predicted nucleic acid-binding protein